MGSERRLVPGPVLVGSGGRAQPPTTVVANPDSERETYLNVNAEAAVVWAVIIITSPPGLHRNCGSTRT